MAAPRSTSPIVQMRLIDTVAGLKIPKTNLGAAVLSSVYLEFKFANATVLYGMAVPFQPGTGTLILASVATDWITVEHSDELQPRIFRLAGLLADVELTGLIVACFGNVDVSIKIYDETGTEIISIANVNRPAQGILAGDAKLRGTLRLLSAHPDTTASVNKNRAAA